MNTTPEETKTTQEIETIEETVQEETAENNATEPKEKNKKKIKVLQLLGSKTAIIIAAVFVVGCFAYYARTFFIAATVNGSTISRLQVIKELEKSSGKQTLDMLVVQSLIDSEARSKGITVNSADIEAAIKSIEDQVTAQGETLDQALATQGITKEDLTNQITVEKKLENLLADKIQVTDDEVSRYITDNKIEIPEGEESTFLEQVKDYLRQQKLSTEASSFIDSLRSQANIKYFVNY
ncbi:MAG: SurA N-terminal domain-containing protein [bacterium]